MWEAVKNILHILFNLIPTTTLQEQHRSYPLTEGH